MCVINVGGRRLLCMGGYLMLGLAAGCRTNPAAAPRETSSPPSYSSSGRYLVLSNDKTYQVSYTPHPDPIPLNKLFSMTAWVSSPGEPSKALTDVTLRADAAMPQHDHGMNTRPKVRSNPDGSFTVSGMNFHMPGHWELYLDVTRAGITERAQFAVELE